jgi:cytochrome b subunit of formate dehydrogenase
MVWLPESMVEWMGGTSGTVFLVRGVLHRIFGTVMILVSLFHVFYLLFSPAGRRWLMDMRPGPKDMGDLFRNVLYYLEIRKEPPAFDRFSYKHKMEYGALIAGTTLMSVTGLLLWFESYWDKFILDISALVHGMEAILACLALLVWHFYEVHLRPGKFPMDKLWLNGVIDEHEMREEYPLHYERIMNDPDLKRVYVREVAAHDE